MKPILAIAAVLCLLAIASAQAPPPLAIVEQSLPSFDAGIETHLLLHAAGGVPPYRWRVSEGELPDGLILAPEGLLVGRATKPGMFSLTITVEDSARPAHSISRDFRGLVSASLLLSWLRPPLIHGSQIDGAVQVSNGSKDDFDLTAIIVAVNALGRATALGYQRMTLKAGATNVHISFVETLPPGTYIVHADAIAEIPAKNTILRQHLQTSSPLLVTQGP